VTCMLIPPDIPSELAAASDTSGLACDDHAAMRRCNRSTASKKLSAGVLVGSIRRCSRKPSSNATKRPPAHSGSGRELGAD
jgi:hypothetical protein